MAPTAGTRGSVDQVVTGLGLDAEAEPPADEVAASAPPPPTGLPALVPPGQERLVARVLTVGAVIVATAALIDPARRRADARSTATSAVPDLVGMSLERGTVAAEDAGFTLATPIDVRRDDVPEGTKWYDPVRRPGPWPISAPRSNRS